MLLVFASIPLMLLGIAVAVVPLIIAMRKEAMEQRQREAWQATPFPGRWREETRAAA